MTTTRPEIVIEGSRDGLEWLSYEFKYKPGDLTRRPAFVAPHQPRLDWQMWFAALNKYERQYWFRRFMGRLLVGSADVVKLLHGNPFADDPPTYVRAMVYNYHFTDPQRRQATKHWWRRDGKRAYSPVLSRRH